MRIRSKFVMWTGISFSMRDWTFENDNGRNPQAGIARRYVDGDFFLHEGVCDTARKVAFPGSHAAHSRIYDRLLSMCVPVRFTGDNFRQEAAQRKMESMKKLITD